MSKEFKVHFLPEGLSVYVLPGTSILEASGRTGIVIDSPCGGQGKCGKCRVEVQKGAVEPTSQEYQILSAEESKKGWRLACQSVIQQDTVIKIPPTSRLSSQKILTSGIEGRKEIKPSLWKAYVDLDTPHLGEKKLSYLEKLRDKFPPFSIGIYLIRRLPELLQKSDFKVTCVFSDSELISIESGNTETKNFGIAFDVGTTTVVGTILNLNTGQELAIASRMNPQIVYGDDIVSRIKFARENGSNSDKLHHKIIETLNEMIAELAQRAKVSKQHIY